MARPFWNEPSESGAAKSCGRRTMSISPARSRRAKWRVEQARSGGSGALAGGYAFFALRQVPKGGRDAPCDAPRTGWACAEGADRVRSGKLDGVR